MVITSPGAIVRATLPGPGASGSSLALDVRTDQSLPAFTRCSLDGDPGTGKKLATAKQTKGRDGRLRKDPYDGDSSGHANRWLYWRTKDVVDEPAAWGMTVVLMTQAPADECTASVTPRRCGRFKPKSGQTFSWTNRAADGRIIQSGKVTADEWHLVTLEKVKVTQAGNRLRIAK